MMERVKRGRHPAKPKNRFTLCCFCVGSSGSDVDLNVPFERPEAYDYVVEKLAIKRVPISLFATDEDLSEMENEAAPMVSGKPSDAPPISPRDKRSAAVFSSYYTMIQKNNACPAALKSKLKRTDVKTNAERKIEIVSRPAVKFKTEDDAVKEITKVEVHKEQNEILKDARMTPKLQETINELGSKKRPTGFAGVNHRTVRRVPHHEVNAKKKGALDEKRIRDLLLKHIMKPEDAIKAEVDKVSTLQLPLVINDSKDLQLPEVKQQLVDDEVTLKDSKTDEAQEEEAARKSKKIGLTSSINLNDFIVNAGTSKSLTSQKWKIIIKEHDREESTSSSSLGNTPEGATDEEETEEEETETEQDAD